MEVTWNGRAYVNEESITPEQYKMFFGKDKYGIKYNIANMILGEMYRDGAEEIVPCDELNADSRETIKEAIRNGHTCGRLECEGETLAWAWEPELTSEGEEITIDALDEYALEYIADQMLNNEAHWGIMEF